MSSQKNRNSSQKNRKSKEMLLHIQYLGNETEAHTSFSRHPSLHGWSQQFQWSRVDLAHLHVLWGSLWFWSISRAGKGRMLYHVALFSIALGPDEFWELTESCWCVYITDGRDVCHLNERVREAWHGNEPVWMHSGTGVATAAWIPGVRRCLCVPVYTVVWGISVV